MPAGLPFLVEPMTLADVAEVMRIERDAFRAPWSAQAYRYEITQNEHSIMRVVRPSQASGSWLTALLRKFDFVGPGPVLGYAGCWLLVDDIHISTIAVHPQWRGKGLGELLLISLLDRGAELGALAATLEVRVSNVAAQRLYHNLGFKIVSLQKNYYADNNEDAYIMVTPPFDAMVFQTNLRQRRNRLYTRFLPEGSARKH